MTSRPVDDMEPAGGDHGRRLRQNTFRADIEGLRAVAVLAVVLFHTEVPGVGGGYVGVDVFFVISGFLITGLLWREAHRSGTVRLRSFYGARARRLLPASAAVGVVTVIAAALLLPPLQARTAFGDGIASALYVSNYRFLLQGVDYSAPYLPPSPFQHYWSLGVEEQFYLVWPPLILGTAWLIRRVRRRTPIEATASRRPYLILLGVIAAFSLALSVAVTYWAPFVAFFSLPTRAWQLALGGLVALSADWWRRLPEALTAAASWAGLALIVAACVVLSTATPYPGTAAMLPTAGAALVIGAGCAGPTAGCGRLLAVAPMRAIGRVSYSWYLWHWPVLLFAPLALGHPLTLAGRLVAAVLSAVAAVITWRYLENPLRFAPRVRNSPRVSLTLGAVATAVAVCAALVLLLVVPTPVGRGGNAAPLAFGPATMPAGPAARPDDDTLPRAFAQVQAAVAASAELRAVPANLSPPLAEAAAELNDVFRNGCLRSAWQVEQPPCASGDVTSTTTVAVVGDSHAAMWKPAFEELARVRNWRLAMLGKAACPLMDLPAHSRQLHRSYTECGQWRANALARLAAEPPKLVVVSMWRGYTVEAGESTGVDAYSPQWNAALTELVRQLRGIGSQVLVLGPIPDPRTVMPICLSGHLDDATACAPDTADAVNRTGIAAEKAATEAAGGRYADLTELFCTAERCPGIVGNTLVYLDANHVTIEYARALSAAMGALVDDVARAED